MKPRNDMNGWRKTGALHTNPGKLPLNCVCTITQNIIQYYQIYNYRQHTKIHWSDLIQIHSVHYIRIYNNHIKNEGSAYKIRTLTTDKMKASLIGFYIQYTTEQSHVQPLQKQGVSNHRQFSESNFIMK
jgi:hypothetical protein